MEKNIYSWFGTNNYCAKLGKLYSNNSMEKSVKLTKLAQINSKKLLIEYERVSSSLSLHKTINSRVDLYSKELNSYFASVSQLENEKIQMDLAATTIQKFIRGHLARIKFSPLLIEVHRRLSNNKLTDLQTESYFCMYHFGRNLETATKLIQRTIRNFLYRQKLKRFEIFYDQILFQRDANKMKNLIRLSHVYFSKFHLKHLRFLRDRERRLKKIRRKLAILTIKNVILRERIVLKALKISIRKYKRRITLGLVNTYKVETEKTHEDETVSNHTEEETKLAKMKKIIEMEEAKRKKIKLGKISYKVGKLKYFKVESRLQKNESDFSAADSIEHATKVKKLSFNLTSDLVKKPKFNRYGHLKSNYMGTTKSFEFAVKGPLWMSNTEQDQPKLPLSKLRSTIYRSTQFSEQKIKKKKVFYKGQKPDWCNKTIVKEQYIPSIFLENDAAVTSLKLPSKEFRKQGKRWKSETEQEIRTVFERKFVEEKSFTPVSCRFEEALPELSRFNKMYPRNKALFAPQIEQKSRENSAIGLYPNINS